MPQIIEKSHKRDY